MVLDYPGRMVTLPSPLSTGLTFTNLQLEARGAVMRRRQESCGGESTQGGSVWGGGVPSPLGNGSKEGAQPPPLKMFGLLSGKWHVLVHSGCYLCTLQ